MLAHSADAQTDLPTLDVAHEQQGAIGQLKAIPHPETDYLLNIPHRCNPRNRDATKGIR
ncbi:hypothetical protein [Pseudomonas panipatensis]|uniref:Uncharacterized protein n=1 Tax=Pseudomonas panipatensis TaxID=428992 RepID=A0A1G8CNL6_9PSED|nr:hypothetical protein [Pseudomonas panipatensis]SDH46932.1 hypothetical protein SAMN05216272_101683 [Pseudomonas panipatensis]SMP64178.1 hypothetical protein SAMN06295951_106159 [Pseudomonas panipatensis]